MGTLITAPDSYNRERYLVWNDDERMYKRIYNFPSRWAEKGQRTRQIRSLIKMFLSLSLSLRAFSSSNVSMSPRPGCFSSRRRPTPVVTQTESRSADGRSLRRVERPWPVGSRGGEWSRCDLVGNPTDRSPIGDRRGDDDGRRGGRRGGRCGGVQQGLPRGLCRHRHRRFRRRRCRRRRCRRRHRCLRVLMSGVRLLQGGLQVADVLDHPLYHLELRQLPLARHVRHEGAQLRQVSGHLLGLEVAPGAADSQAIVQAAAMVGRHSATHRAHHHRLHADRGDQKVIWTAGLDRSGACSFLSTLVREHTAAAAAG